MANHRPALCGRGKGKEDSKSEIKEVMDQLHAYGFNGDVVESVNVHDDIKIGKPTRDALIENYKQCIRMKLIDILNGSYDPQEWEAKGYELPKYDIKAVAAKTYETDRHSFTAPFVNAEETQYLVIEDNYTNGRPPLDLGGVLFTERETVDKVETMKVTTCLNPLHTAMSIYGCMLGFNLISAEMKDEDIRSFIQKIGYIEAMPVVTDPGVLNPYEFIGAVLNRRLPNPFMPDAPQRIAMDTSQKLPIRFGETIKKYHERGLDMDNLVLIPLVLAGYAR